jgi:hypothetical protein
MLTGWPVISKMAVVPREQVMGRVLWGGAKRVLSWDNPA